jgi:beta-lactamase superfamily II metal-dependent hydrolase
MSLGVHVLGPGYGESIILELPDGQLGVIDCFRDPFGRSCVAEFLHERFQTDSLLFLAITHPHADHCSGSKELLDRFKIQELWTFDSIQMQELRDYLYLLTRSGISDPSEEDLFVAEGTVLREILMLRRNIVERRRTRPKGRVRLLRSKENFTLCDGAIRVRCLTPGSGATVDYRERLSLGLRKTVGAIGAKGRLGGENSLNQNLASSALLFQYKKTNLLFLADAETPLLEEWSRECEEDTNLKVGHAQFVKVAHHGSSNGFSQLLYDSTRGADGPIMVITPFSRSRSPLPSPQGTEQLSRQAMDLVCTNRHSAHRSSARDWKFPEHSYALPALPIAWAVAITADRRLAALLAPPYGPNSPGETDLSVPIPWIQDCVRNRDLLSLLHPRFGGTGQSTRRPTSADEFLVSYYFNDEGREETEKRYLARALAIWSKIESL